MFAAFFLNRKLVDVEAARTFWQASQQVRVTRNHSKIFARDLVAPGEADNAAFRCGMEAASA
jgi:hypothetical protein